MTKYVISLDAGTTSSRTILFTHDGEIAAVDQKEFTQIFPQPGWVEHDPLEIWETQRQTLIGAMENAGARPSDIAGIGITNQRETTVVWDKNTGEPVYNAIVWQCRRTAERIEQLKADGLSDYVQQTTGLIPDPYFSGSKIAWILDEVPGARERAEAGDLLFGTIDTWLTWKLTGGRAHVTDVTNASRTMIFDIHNLCWDKKLLEYFRIPESMLPRVASSSEIVGYTDAAITGGEIPVSGIAGDQQAALFGQCCTCSGDVKNTYGTGCFTLMNTGTKAITSSNGLLTTIAYGYGGKVYYALEGSVFVAGAVVQWLRDEMRVLESARDSEKSCLAVEDTAGVYVVPAFAGLGAPYWNPYARGMVTGLTRGTSRDHFIRATVESMAYQVYDLIKAMEKDSGLSLATLKVDGGAAANNFLMQFQADLLDKNIERPKCIETTAQGAAYLAGLATGFWKDLDDVAANRKVARVFTSEITEEKRNERITGWEKAVDACSYWGKKA